MNKVILSGRLTKDPDIKYGGENNVATLKANLAVQRGYKNKDGKYDADFITIVAFKHNAEFIEKYFHKGSQMIVEGEWHTGHYDNKEGNTIYTNECFVSKVEFCGSKADNEQTDHKAASTPEKANGKPKTNTESDDFVDVEDAVTGDIPFFG